MFTLKIIQAKYGDCLILKYNNEEEPKYILIDGGPGGVYREHLKQELIDISKDGGELELMVLSHVDGDHIVGLIDLTEELKEQQADEETPVIGIKGLWMNSFSDSIGKGNNLTNAVQGVFSRVQNIQSTMPEGNLAFLSIAQGYTLRRNALLLKIPLNEIMNQDLISYENMPEPVSMDNIKITIIGPNQKNLEKLREEWQEWVEKFEAKAMTTDRELLRQMDRSVPNLSSIMFLVEADGKSILFTGDGRGDFILEGLEQAQLLDDHGNIHLDVFKAPHHGSIRNASEDFFKRVTADKYVISANGRHHNPDFDTLKWIVQSAVGREAEVELICTNVTDSTEQLVADFPPSENNYQIIYLSEDAHSYNLELAN